MNDGFVLSAEDRSILREIVSEYTRSRQMGAAFRGTGSPQQSTDVYFAKNDYGIPARYGTIPGSAECVVCRINQQTFEIEPIQVGDDYLRKTIYNVSDVDITDEYVPIAKSKNGKWLAVTAGGGGGLGNEWIDFRVYQICPSLPDGAIQAVYAEVVGTSCHTSVNIGEIVLVYDTRNCWFNVPIELLSTLSGRADLTAGHDEQVLFCAEYRSLGECYWKVTSLCCYEEPY